MLGAAAETTDRIEKLLSRLSLFAAYCVRGSAVEGLERLGAGRFRALLAVDVQDWCTGAPQPQTAAL